ncbi:MAG: hypothetical protein ACREOU_11880 [Candidatus Eiseniibacteriota bacterium]
MSDLFKDHGPRMTEEEDRRLWERVRTIPGEVEAESEASRARERASGKAPRTERREPWWRGWFALPAVRYGVPALAVVLVAVVWVVQQNPTSPMRSESDRVRIATEGLDERPAPAPASEVAPTAPSGPAEPSGPTAPSARARVGSRDRREASPEIVTQEELSAGAGAPDAKESQSRESLNQKIERRDQAANQAEPRSGFATPPGGTQVTTQRERAIDSRAQVPAPAPAPPPSAASGDAAKSVAGTAQKKVNEEAKEPDQPSADALHMRGGRAGQVYYRTPHGAFDLAAVIAQVADVSRHGPLSATVRSAHDPGVVLVIAAAATPGAGLEISPDPSARVRVLAGSPGPVTAAGERRYELEGTEGGRVAVLEVTNGQGTKSFFLFEGSGAKDDPLEGAVPPHSLRDARVRTAVIAVELARALARTDSGRRLRLEEVRANALLERSSRPDDRVLEAVLAECERALSAGGR